MLREGGRAPQLLRGDPAIPVRHVRPLGIAGVGGGKRSSLGSLRRALRVPTVPAHLGSHAPQQFQKGTVTYSTFITKVRKYALRRDQGGLEIGPDDATTSATIGSPHVNLNSPPRSTMRQLAAGRRMCQTAAGFEVEMEGLSTTRVAHNPFNWMRACRIQRRVWIVRH